MWFNHQSVDVFFFWRGGNGEVIAADSFYHKGAVGEIPLKTQHIAQIVFSFALICAGQWLMDESSGRVQKRFCGGVLWKWNICGYWCDDSQGTRFCYDVFCSSYWNKRRKKKEFWLLTLEAGWFNNMPWEHTGSNRWLCGQLCLASVENDRFTVSESAHSATRKFLLFSQNGWIWTCCCHLVMVRRVGTVRFSLWDCVIGNSLLILNRADGNLLTQTSLYSSRTLIMYALLLNSTCQCLS